MSMRLLSAALIVSAAMAASAAVPSLSVGQTPPGTVEVSESAQATRPLEEEPQPRQESKPVEEPRPAEGSGSRPVSDTAVSIDFEEEVLDDRIGFIEKRLTETAVAGGQPAHDARARGAGGTEGHPCAPQGAGERCGPSLSEQERLTAQDMRNKERLVDLVERYGAGDWVARHIKVELERVPPPRPAECRRAVH